MNMVYLAVIACIRGYLEEFGVFAGIWRYLGLFGVFSGI